MQSGSPTPKNVIKFDPVPETGITELGAKNNQEAFEGISRPWVGEAWLVIPADLQCDTELLALYEKLRKSEPSTYAIYGKPEEIVKAWQKQNESKVHVVVDIRGGVLSDVNAFTTSELAKSHEKKIRKELPIDPEEDSLSTCSVKLDGEEKRQ